MSGALLAGVELGGTKCICVLGSADGRIVDEARVPTGAPGETLAAIEAILESWDIARRASALGIASFGPLQLDRSAPDYGSVTRTSKPGWSGASLLACLGRFALPTLIDTDVTGAALAEGRWGGARGLASHAYITVGTGIGAGVIVGGQPVRGIAHAEAGHMRVGRLAGDAWPGICPYHGDCVEGLASGVAIEARAGCGANRLAADDPVWDKVAHALAGMIHNLVLTAVPQRILLGGGVIARQPHLVTRIRAALVASLAGYGVGHQLADRMDEYVAPASLGPSAGPLGAIALAADAAALA